jgi:photosystem II PsbY protein
MLLKSFGEGNYHQKTLKVSRKENEVLLGFTDQLPWLVINLKISLCHLYHDAWLESPLQQFCGKDPLVCSANGGRKVGNATAGAMFAAMTMPDSAMASQQLMALAADDNRGIALLLPLVPAIGWVLFNILQPGLNQFNKMRGVKAVVAGAGLGALATMMVAPHASAAQEIATLADSDSRGLLLLGILVPAVAWVLYNILQPALNQLDKLRSSKGVVGALGLGAVSSMYLTPQAEAVQVHE